LGKEETRELVPEIYMDQIPGIPGINGIDLFYGSWHLLNEGLTCFVNREYFACLMCLSTSVELWLKRSLNSHEEFVKLLEQAKEQKLIDEKEYYALNDLRKDRNSFVHFDIDKLPKSKNSKTKSVRIEPSWTDEQIEKAREICSEEVDVYATAAHRDMLPLASVTVTSYFHLNTVTEFFQKRYPQQDSLIDTYYNFALIKIKGLNEEQIVFHLASKKKSKKSRFNFIKYIRSSMGI
jgi:hypothetical protein